MHLNVLFLIIVEMLFCIQMFHLVITKWEPQQYGKYYTSKVKNAAAQTENNFCNNINALEKKLLDS